MANNGFSFRINVPAHYQLRAPLTSIYILLLYSLTTEHERMFIDNISLLTTQFKVRKTSILQIFTFVYYFQKCKRQLIVITNYGTSRQGQVR